MYILHLRARAKSPRHARQLCRYYRTVVTLGMVATGGFLEAVCCYDVDDPCVINVLEHWGSLPALRWWERSPVRQQFIQQSERCLDPPIERHLLKELA